MIDRSAEFPNESSRSTCEARLDPRISLEPLSLMFKTPIGTLKNDAASNKFEFVSLDSTRRSLAKL